MLCYWLHWMHCFFAFRTQSPLPVTRLGTQRFVTSSLQAAEDAFARLANGPRSWSRLRHIAEMALSREHRTVADIGTDHGLLATGLAATGHFRSVIGVDVSESALNEGARRVLAETDLHLSESGKDRFPLEFRLGSGLSPLAVGDCDTVCIAGMGVNTMEQILLELTSDGTPLLDSLQCKALLLQPTNTRPRNLIQLYDSLQKRNWYPRDERVSYLSSRWYWNVAFERSEASFGDRLLPGLTFSLDRSPSEQWALFLRYVDEHCRWLDEDQRRSGLRGREDEWLQHFLPLLADRQ